MTRQHLLLALNVLLATVILAVLLGCGGDPEDPPAGSLAEKLCDGCGKWTSDPVAYTEMDQDGKMIEKSTRIKIDFSNWRQSGMSCSKPSGIGAPPNERSRISGFTYGDNTASSGHVTQRHSLPVHLPIGRSRPESFVCHLDCEGRKEGTRQGAFHKRQVATPSPTFTICSHLDPCVLLDVLAKLEV